MVLSTACNMDFDPTSAYSEKTFWYSAKNAQSGLTGCYLPLRNGSFYGGATMAFEECVTPNAYQYSNEAEWNDIALGNHTSTTAIFGGRWKDAYIGIGRCNFLLANIDYNQELTSEAILQMKAQARFLRALYYSVLTTYYYKAPLVTDAPNISMVGRQRTDRDVIIDFIITELDAVAKILPTVYPNSGDRGRVTAGAALALKARVLNFEASPLLNPTNDAAKWKKAADAALDVMHMGIYSLYSDYRGLFTEAAEHSVESIFNVEAIGNPTGLGHSADLIFRQYNSSAPLKDFVESYWMKDGKPRPESIYGGSPNYEDIEPRFYSTIVYPGGRFMGETVKPEGDNILFKTPMTGFTYRKYTVYDENPPAEADKNIGANSSRINRMILRYADILLMYAEAKNEMGEMTEDIWNRTVKAIRQRAGFTATAAVTFPGNDDDAIKGHIRYGRRIEFAAEGTYYDDLRRWKEMENVMPGPIYKHDGTQIVIRSFNKDRDYWWPVPATQMSIAPTLAPNNPGWGSN